MNFNAPECKIPEGMDFKDFQKRVVEIAMENKDQCAIDEVTEDDWQALDDFMQSMVEYAGGKWPRTTDNKEE